MNLCQNVPSIPLTSMPGCSDQDISIQMLDRAKSSSHRFIIHSSTNNKSSTRPRMLRIAASPKSSTGNHGRQTHTRSDWIAPPKKTKPPWLHEQCLPSNHPRPVEDHVHLLGLFESEKESLLQAITHHLSFEPRSQSKFPHHRLHEDPPAKTPSHNHQDRPPVRLHPHLP